MPQFHGRVDEKFAEWETDLKLWQVEYKEEDRDRLGPRLYRRGLQGQPKIIVKTKLGTQDVSKCTVESTPAEAHWQMGQVDNNARYLRQNVNTKFLRTIVDVSQNDFQTMLDELTDAKNSLVQHTGYMPRQWVFGLIPRVPGHMLEENSDLPNLDPEGRYRRIAEMRHKCRMAATDTKANAEIRQSLIGRSRPMQKNTCLEILCIAGEQGLVCIKHKVSGWDPFGSSELKEEMSGCHIVRQLPNVQRSSCVWHHPHSERCDRC